MNTHTRTHQRSSREGHAINSPSLPLYFQENKPSHAALISSKLSDLDALLRKGGAPEAQAPSTPQQQQLIRPVAVQAVCLLSRTCISSRSSSHAGKERAQPHLLLLLVVVVVVVAHGPRQPAVQCSTQRRTAQSRVTWARAANVPQALHGRKRVSTEACEGPVSRCLVPAMHGSAPSTRRHTQVGEELHCGCASS